MAEAFLYEPVLIELKRLFESVGVAASLEITATTGASDKVAQAIVPGLEILFAFLSSNKPDILGVDDKRRWIVAEIKDGGLGLEDVYQAKKYKELFSAPFGFLVTAAPIPTRLRRLCESTPFDSTIFRRLLRVSGPRAVRSGAAELCRLVPRQSI